MHHHKYSVCCYLCSAGVVFALISNEQVNESIRNFDDTVNTALNNSLDFVDDVQMVEACEIVIILVWCLCSKLM